MVISVDEKTGSTARSRKHPGRSGRPGRRTRRESGYVRHGTVSVIAALNVHSGQVLSETIARNNAGTFICFLRILDPSIPAGTGIHLVMDNGSSHVAKKTKARLAARSRFHFHSTHAQARKLDQPGSRSSRPSPADYCAAANSPPATNRPHASTSSHSPATNTMPSPTGGPTTARHSKPPDSRKSLWGHVALSSTAASCSPARRGPLR